MICIPADKNTKPIKVTPTTTGQLIFDQDDRSVVFSPAQRRQLAVFLTPEVIAQLKADEPMEAAHV